MADNTGFRPQPKGNQEPVYATNTGDGTTDGTGLITPLYRNINPITGAVTYETLDGAAYTPDAALETIDLKPVRVRTGTEVLAVAAAAVPFASIPANTVLAEVQVHVGEDNLAYTTSGTDPDPAAHIGRLANAGDYFHVEGEQEVNDFRAISLDSTGSAVGTAVNLYIEYFNVTEDGSYVK